MALAALLGGAIGPAAAQQTLEIIPLRHRTADQVLPILQPLVEPGGTLGGSRGQLFLRSSPGNAADIKRALAAIDRPARRLVISVRFEDAAQRERRAFEAAGTIGSGGARVAIGAQDSRRTASERVEQRVQVLEGGRATIFAGQSLPERDFASGFEVVPRFAGGDVVLEIFQRRDTRQAQQAASSTVSARLGEWVELAAAAESTARQGRGIASSSEMRASESRRVWVKVDEASN